VSLVLFSLVGLAPLPLRDMLGALYFYSCLGSKASLCAKQKKRKKRKRKLKPHVIQTQWN
jgi:hypothetical protein